ncbi:MAG: hypothetical protein EOO75_07960 [Myxococcales bacterium]|nr:MAG: hypothetical protein EOO75_07960 [Myxococcales bacterium]
MTAGTAMCAQMSYEAPAGVDDPCTYFAAASCLRRDLPSGVEVITAVNQWTPAQMGEGWASCDYATGQQVAALPVCP